MITIQLDVEDLADTRFAISPLVETVCSLWALRRPSLYSHRPERLLASVPSDVDTALLGSLVGPTLAIPDFLTPRPARFATKFDSELATIRGTSPERVRADVRAVYAQGRQEIPPQLAAVDQRGNRPLDQLLQRICNELQRYWESSLNPIWPRIRLVLEADTTYRAHRLATGGARLLFADLHPNLRWQGGALRISKMIGQHRVVAGGRGLLLVPSLFAYKPIPPMRADEPPWIAYPTRGAATLFETPASTDPDPLISLLGAPRALILRTLNEPLPTNELARRIGVTPSAISQQLNVLSATGLTHKSRNGRSVLYRRSRLAAELMSATTGVK
jgi:DNA-binding transcriptional ArsR family regulator